MKNMKYYLVFGMHLESYFCYVVMDFAVMAGSHDEALELAADMGTKASSHIKVLYSSGKVSIEITPNKYFDSAKLTNFRHYDETLGEYLTIRYEDGFELYPVDNPICYVPQSYSQMCAGLFAKLEQKSTTFEGLSYGVMSEEDVKSLID